jgi:pyruvate carboxylase
MKFSKILVANRGEIAIRIFRAASELHIKTVAIYTFEDRYSLHRYKADESYQIGEDDEPLKPYLDIEEILSVAKANGVDAIHPGYGFLSENVNFARRCREVGITLIAPTPEAMQQLGDKIASKKVAIAAGVPIIEDSKVELTTFEIAKTEAHRIGYPVMLKASAGGGGRGMRVVRNDIELEKSFREARAEAAKAFGDDTVFFEKFIESPKHIEVQILADNYGNIVHLFERDCSVQRRFQKVVELAPSQLSQHTKYRLFGYALSICKKVNYNNAGTVEFLVDNDENIYFIEVNPRIQVEHTITEEITGIDIVRCQIFIAQGYKLSDPEIGIPNQESITADGYAIQCRVTTEDPRNGFKPDYGTVITYRNAAGFGIRLDEGNCYDGVKISPFFDSMLVKVSAFGKSLKAASERLDRALEEFRIRGVKTNIGFLRKVLIHPTFREGKVTVDFIEKNPDLMNFEVTRNRATLSLYYLANVIVNGNPDVKKIDKDKKFRNFKIPAFDKHAPYPKGTKDLLNELGREGFIEWLKNDQRIHYTDTTFRDAHQSLLATRMRTIDMFRVAESYAKNIPQTFSVECWGGATFDVCLRFLRENPWQRLELLRKAMPNILLQMLLRGANGVGYKSYPDNLVEKFIEKSAEKGIDIFRIFDSLNWVEQMKVSIKAVRNRTNSLAEASICYTGDILDKNNTKYSLQYYLDLAKRLEDEGAHILGIKDMTGLLKPYAAELLIKSLKEVISLPIHLHTHDTSSIQSATYLKAIEAGVNVIDVACASMSGLTSQPNFNSLIAMLQGHHPRENAINLPKLNEFSNYWEDIREYYYPFESDLKAGGADVYEHEIPGGQYSNLRPQAEALGLGEKFEQIKKNYAIANKLFGDIVKVTPSSKVVGDFALFMTSNNLTAKDVMEKGMQLSFPESVIELFRGDIGQPEGGFPEDLQKIILKNIKPFTNLPNEHLKPIDFEAEWKSFKEKYDTKYYDELDLLSYLFYPKVFEEYYQARAEFGNLMYFPTLPFFYGLKENEETMIGIDKGKTLIIKYLHKTTPDKEGICKVAFELNGQTRVLRVKDKKFQTTRIANRKASRNQENEIATPLQGRIAEVFVKAGDSIKPNQPLFVIEAMKMESTITASKACKIQEIVLGKGQMVEQDDLVLVVG